MRHSGATPSVRFYDGHAWAGVPYLLRGFVTLAAGTATVANTSITANSIIRLFNYAVAGTPGALYIASKTAGTGFTIASTSGTDTSSVRYEITLY